MIDDLPLLLKSLPFALREAHDLGVKPARLRRNDLARPFRGVRVRSDLTLTAIDGFAPLLRAGHAVSHATAAVLWGMWLPLHVAHDQSLDVLAIGSARPVRMKGVRGHHADAGSVEVEMLRGLPVTSPVDTFRMLSERLTLEHLVEAGDSLIRRHHPLLAWPDLERSVRRHFARRGAKNLARAIALCRSGCDSPMETRVRLILLAHGLPEPAVNAIVSRPGERTRYGDMVYDRWRVIVEYDGNHHRTGAQYVADVERLEQLARAGWTVIRVLKEQLEHPHLIAERVRRALRDAGWRS